MRDMFPRFRTASSPTMRIKERCKKLLFRRQSGAKGGSLRYGIANSLRDESRKVKGAIVKTDTLKESEESDRTINLKNLTAGKKKLGEISEGKNAVDEIKIGKDRDLDTGDKFTPRIKRTMEYKMRNSKKVNLDLREELGEGRECHVILGSDQERHLIGKSPHGTMGNAYPLRSPENTNKLSPAQRKRTNDDDIDDIFSLLET